MVDSSIIKVHQHGMRSGENKAEQGIGKTRGGWGTKIHAVVDGLGYPIEIKLTEGQINDCTQAVEILSRNDSERVIADKGYDTNEIREYLRFAKREAVIPNFERRLVKYEYDTHEYKERHLVENHFRRLKEWRRIATRYEKTLRMFQGMIVIGCVLIWIMF
jgi:transposase